MIVVVISMVSFVAFVYVIGMLIPKRQEYVKKAEFKVSPEMVFQSVTDFKNQASWRKDLQEIRVKDENTWTEISSGGTAITFKTKQKVQNQFFEIEIIEAKGFKGYWVGTFEQTAVGTAVVFKEVVIIENPFFRVLSLLFVDLDKSMNTYVDNLEKKLGD